MYFGSDIDEPQATETPSQRPAGQWWSHRIVRSDLWVELRGGSTSSSSSSAGRRAVVAFVAKCAVGWSDAAAGRTSIDAVAHRVDDAFEALVTDHADVVEAFQLGAMRHSCTFAVRCEVVCMVICHAVWSQFAQLQTVTESSGTHLSDNFALLLTSLIRLRWLRWSRVVSSHFEGLTSAASSINTEPRSALLFLGVVAQVLGLLEVDTAGSSAAPTKEVLKVLIRIMPTLFEAVVAHSVSLVKTLSQLLHAGGGSTQSLVGAVTQLVAHLTADAVIVEITVDEGATTVDCRHNDGLKAIVVELQALFERLLTNVLGSNNKEACQGDDEEAAGTTSAVVVTATHRALCQALQAVQRTIGTYQRLLVASTRDDGSAVVAAPDNAILSRSVLDMFIDAALEDASLSPTSKTLARMLLQRTTPKDGLDDPNNVAAAMKGLMASGPSPTATQISSDHREVLTALLRQSPVLWFQAFFTAVTRRSSATTLTSFANIDDESGAVFQLGSICRASSTASTAAVGEGGVDVAVAKHHITGLDQFAQFYFKRHWCGYHAAEAFLSSALDLTAMDDLSCHRIQRVIAEAAKIALDFHAQQSGSPVAVDHLQCLWWIASCDLQHVAMVPSNTTSNAVAAPLSIRLPIFSAVSLRIFTAAPTAGSAASTATGPTSPSGGSRRRRQKRAAQLAAAAAASSSTPAALSVDALDDEDEHPSLAYLHRNILDGASTLFGWFLPVLQALGVDNSNVKSLDDANRVLTSEAVLDQASALLGKRRAVMYFLQCDVLSRAGESYRAPATEPGRHARHFLSALWTSQVSRSQFVDIAAEAGILISLRAYRVESIVKNVAPGDIDAASAFFFGVLRLLRRCKDSEPLADCATQVTAELSERLSNYMVRPVSMQASKKQQIRRYLLQCMTMATGFSMPAPIVDDEPHMTLAAEADASAPPVEAEGSASPVAAEVDPSPPPTTEAELPTPTKDSQSIATADAVSAHDVIAGEATFEPTESNIESNSSSGALPPAEMGSQDIAPLEPQVAAEVTPPDSIEVTPPPVADSTLLVVPPQDASIDGEVAEASTAVVTPAPPAVVVKEYRAPPVANNLWIEWMWSVSFQQISSPEDKTPRSLTLPPNVTKFNVSHQVLQQLRAGLRDEAPWFVQASQKTFEEHRAVLSFIFEPAVAANKLVLLRPVVAQWMSELVLRASLSIPDARVAVLVLHQLFVILGGAPVSQLVGPFTPIVPKTSRVFTTELPLMLCDAVKHLARLIHGQLGFPSTLRTSRCLAYFLTEVTESVLFGWRRAAVHQSRKGANQGGKPATLPLSHAVFAVMLGAPIVARKELDIIKDVFMETARTLEALLHLGTDYTDSVALAIKRECVGWLGLYEASALRIADAERKRRDGLRKADPALSDDHPVIKLRAMEWSFPEDQPKMARAVPMLFDFPGGSGGQRKRDRTPERRPEASRNDGRRDERGGRRRSNSRDRPSNTKSNNDNNNSQPNKSSKQQVPRKDDTARRDDRKPSPSSRRRARSHDEEDNRDERGRRGRSEDRDRRDRGGRRNDNTNNNRNRR